MINTCHTHYNKARKIADKLNADLSPDTPRTAVYTGPEFECEYCGAFKPEPPREHVIN